MRSFTNTASLVLLATTLLAETPPQSRVGIVNTPPAVIAAERQPPAHLFEPAPIAAALPRLPIQNSRVATGGGDVLRSVGVVRSLAAPVDVAARLIYEPRSATAGETSSRWQWRGRVHVEGAEALRLRLTNIRAGTATPRLWVLSGVTEPLEFDLGGAHDGLLWSPMTLGDTVTLAVEASMPFALAIDAVAEIKVGSSEAPACTLSAACVSSPGVSSASRAIAFYTVVKGGEIYTCSGGLVTDRAGTFTPYFVTANHCVSTAAEAASVEAYWDYRPASCGAAAPALPSLQRSVGATLLATSLDTDVTLLRFPINPSGRAYLGWRFEEYSAGTAFYRISHPVGGAQGYSTHVLETQSPACTGVPRSRFLYTSTSSGVTTFGSSGAPLLYGSDLQMVGQLTGGCPGGMEACSPFVRATDGSIWSSWNLLKPFLDPQVAACGTCVPSNGTACLLGGRFKVAMTWRDLFAKLAGAGSIIRFTENRPEIHPLFGPLSESAFFSMYSFSPNSLEVIVRMIKGANHNDKYWVFLTGFAGAEYTVEVTDTQTCRVWRKTVPSGATTVTKDFEAFPFP